VLSVVGGGDTAVVVAGLMIFGGLNLSNES
jgi:hypothetical protein